MMHVRFLESVFKSFMIAFSLSLSKLAVPSSRIKILGSFKTARAKIMRCLYPPERSEPLSLSLVSYPSGRDIIKS